MEYRFLLSYVLVLIAVYYTYRERLGLHKRILFNTIRAFLQLLLLGYILLYVFQIENPAGLFLILLIMCIFASVTAQKRAMLFPMGYLLAFAVIFMSSVIVLMSMIAVKVISLASNELIPLGGMIIGNSLNIYTLVVDRLKSEATNTLELIESRIALGADIKQALRPAAKEATKAAFIPILNTLQTVGIIHIPGITTGMLIAGVEPLKAISYQLAILYMLVAVALFTGYFTLMITLTKIIPVVYITQRR